MAENQIVAAQVPEAQMAIPMLLVFLENYPHIFEGILRHLPLYALPSLMATCRTLAGLGRVDPEQAEILGLDPGQVNMGHDSPWVKIMHVRMVYYMEHVQFPPGHHMRGLGLQCEYVPPQFRPPVWLTYEAYNVGHNYGEALREMLKDLSHVWEMRLVDVSEDVPSGVHNLEYRLQRHVVAELPHIDDAVRGFLLTVLRLIGDYKYPPLRIMKDAFETLSNEQRAQLMYSFGNASLRAVLACQVGCLRSALALIMWGYNRGVLLEALADEAMIRKDPVFLRELYQRFGADPPYHAAFDTYFGHYPEWNSETDYYAIDSFWEQVPSEFADACHQLCGIRVQDFR